MKRKKKKEKKRKKEKRKKMLILSEQAEKRLRKRIAHSVVYFSSYKQVILRTHRHDH